ncbi:MAG: DNA-processing protein DprA, partial [Deltaproteobacteria bacterium]
MADQDQHLTTWLALSLSAGIGPAVGRRLLSRFKGPEEVFRASAPELRQVSGLSQQSVDLILAGGARREAAEQIDRCRNEGVGIIPLCSDNYPLLLARIDNPPLQLYVKGDTSLLQTDCIAIVGARAATSYGVDMARRFAADLANRGYTVVSGMASGIDAAAHYGCLEAKGRTLAVLGCGVNRVYPPQNRTLYQRIVSHGALISEYPLDTEPDAFRFPARNRIISGLSLGVMVVEAAKRSGSVSSGYSLISAPWLTIRW